MMMSAGETFVLWRKGLTLKKASKAVQLSGLHYNKRIKPLTNERRT